MKENGILYSDNVKKAEILNDQFKSVFSKDDPSEPHPLPNPEFPKIQDINITEPGVRKLLQNLKPNKASGPDNISPLILKTLAPEIAPSLTLIFQKSYETSEVPEDWRTANVSPIFKKGEKYTAANYRPVSLTCICSKLMEHIITSHILKHSNENNILYNLQHGFRPKLSCETQLVEFVHDISKNMVSGTQTDVIVMDFSKAFDKVSHKKLSQKLHHYGIVGKTHSWINAFLTNRTQKVVVNGDSSSSVLVASGVPQGSVLGPSLFLFYINNMPDNIKSTVRLFADDTIIYIALKPNTNNSILQEDLDKLASWEKNWKMEFHPQKCQVIHITKNRNKIKNTYTLNGHTLESADNAKYLGVTITSDLSWNQHIDNITKKANKTLGFVRRNVKTSSQNIKTQAYFTLVRPILEYASPVWNPHTKNNINKIEMVQRRAARYVCNRYHNTSSVTNMIHSLGWRSLQARRVDAKLVLFYKIVNGLVAIPISTYLTPVIRKDSTFHNTQAFLTYTTTIDYFMHSFFPSTIKLWNHLPENIVSLPNLDTYKTQVQSLPQIF